MFGNSDKLDVCLVAGVTDMRKSIDGLCDVVAFHLEQEPVSERLFVFCNRYRDKLKILHWGGSGFWLHYKRLETDKFQWPGIDDEQLSIEISRKQLGWLLDGLPLAQPNAHPLLNYHYHDC